MGVLLTIVGGEFDRRTIKRSSPFGKVKRKRIAANNAELGLFRIQLQNE
jgi:hypothetical protein